MVTRLVVDASVGVKWFVVEAGTPTAISLLMGRYELVVPAHFFAEMGNAIVTKVRRGLADAAVAERTARELRSSSLTVIQLPDLLEEAIAIAFQFGLSLYDALYLALALREGCQLITADRRLRDAVSTTYPGTVLLLDDLAPA